MSFRRMVSSCLCVCICVFMLFFLFIWTTKKSLVWNSSWIMSRQWWWWWLWPRPHLYLCFTRFEPCFCDSVFRVFFPIAKKKRCEISYISTNIDDTILNGQFILLNWKLYLTAEKTNPIASSLMILYCRKNEILIVEKKTQKSRACFQNIRS